MLNEASIATFKARLRGGLIEPSDPSYEAARKVFSERRQGSGRPKTTRMRSRTGPKRVADTIPCSPSKSGLMNAIPVRVATKPHCQCSTYWLRLIPQTVRSISNFTAPPTRGAFTFSSRARSSLATSAPSSGFAMNCTSRPVLVIAT
jgi:hypothetical protein